MVYLITDVEHLKDRIQRVKDKTGERWTPDFVLGRIESGNAAAFAFVGFDAFMVVERVETFETVLNVWVLEGVGVEPHKRDVVNELDALARQVGASHWKWESPRKGWGRALRGFAEPVRTVYERKVP